MAKYLTTSQPSNYNETSVSLFIGALFPQQNQESLDLQDPRITEIDFDSRNRLAFRHALLSLNEENSAGYEIITNVLEYSSGAEHVFQITKQGKYHHVLKQNKFRTVKMYKKLK